MGITEGAAPDMPAGVSVDTLVDYVEKYHPGFSAAIQGASEGEVLELEELVGQKLPATYRQFLRRMGHGRADLRLMNQYDDTTLEAVTEYHRDLHLPPPTIVPEDCLFILESEIGGTDLFLCPKCAPDPQVVMNGPEGYFAVSLLSLLYRIAFRTFRLDALTRHEYVVAMGGDGRDVMPEAAAVAEAMGFRRQWFSDRRDFCGERPGGQPGPGGSQGKDTGEAALYLQQRHYTAPYDGLMLTIAARTAAEAERLAAPFVTRFGPSR